MIQEDKQLLLKDLSARLFYGVKFQGEDSKIYTLDAANYFALQVENVVFKPYLRPMSSMTEDEEDELNNVSIMGNYGDDTDWLNAHHFDYHIVPSTGKTLIESGLALKAPEGMYGNV